jgi:hypothetical protein
MRRTLIGSVIGLLAAICLIVAWGGLRPAPRTAHEIRRELLAEVWPVALKNCTLERIGKHNDGGYLVCGNLLGNARSAYSYGIAGEDSWGCDIARRFHVTVHQYDCFDPTRPVCEGGQQDFHDECVGGKPETIESRLYDSVANHIQTNGDAGQTLVMKMDVEGAELDALGVMPDELLDTIDQLVMELHAADDRYLTLVKKLKRTFVPVHLHFNNSRCTTQFKPFPSPVYEVSFVNRRIAQIDPAAPRPTLPRTLDEQNTLFHVDCQRLVE